MANIILLPSGKGKNETLTKSVWKNACQLRCMEEDKYLSRLIIHMGIHIVQLCMCVIIYLDLENKSCCLVRRCLSVNFDGKYFILGIVCALVLWADSCGLLIFNRFPCKHEDQLIAVSLTSREKKAMEKKLPEEWRHGMVYHRRRNRDSVCECQKRRKYGNYPARGDFAVKTVFP